MQHNLKSQSCGCLRHLSLLRTPLIMTRHNMIPLKYIHYHVAAFRSTMTRTSSDIYTSELTLTNVRKYTYRVIFPNEFETKSEGSRNT